MGGGSSLPGPLAEALHGERVPKFLATLDATGAPNVVPILSLDAADDRTLCFGEFLIQKTRANLLADPRVCAAVLTEDLHVWTVRGRFREFVEGGPMADMINRKDMFRYNPYLGISRVAVIDVEAVTGAWGLSRLEVALELLPVKVAGQVWGRLPLPRSGPALPPRVAEKFARTQAVKFMAWRGADGYPDMVPAFSLSPGRGPSMLFGTRLFGDRLRTITGGARVAASVITFDPVAYQVKGTYEGTTPTPAGAIGRLRVDQVFSASPPLPGQQIEMHDRR